MNDRRRGLGRGLGALIPSEAPEHARPGDVFSAGAQPRETERQAPHESNESASDRRSDLAEVPGATFALLPVTSIKPNPQQPRQEFNEDELAELVHSITEVGVLQPVVVRAASPRAGADSAGGTEDASYELIMGERRLRAAIAAGLDRIPAIMRDTADDALLRDALLENLHRSQLNPLEEAAAYQQLLHDFGCTHEVLAERIGRSRPQISNTVRLLKLPGPVQRRVASGILSAGHARAILGLSDPAAMEHLAARIVAEGLSVRSVEEIVLLSGDSADKRASRPRQTREPDADMAQWSQRLSDRLDTRVTIAMGKRRGKLSVDFASREDLERILDILGR